MSLKVIETDAIQKLGYGFLFAFYSNYGRICSVAVCEIFSVKEWCDLENRVKVRSRSLEMAPFDRSHMSSYSSSVVTMAISCIVCEIATYWYRKSRNFIPTCIYGPRRGSRRNFVRCFMLVKLEWLGYRMVKKNYDDMLSRFHTIPACHGETDRWTDRQTDGHTELLYKYRASVCWRVIKTDRRQFLDYSLSNSFTIL